MTAISTGCVDVMVESGSQRIRGGRDDRTE
jgi:hypothetical protein